MIKEIQAWGIKLAWVTGDSWYSIVENLKFLRNEKVGFFFGIASNRICSVERGIFQQIQKLTIADLGLLIYLRDFCLVKVFSQNFRNEVRQYIICHQEENELSQTSRSKFRTIHDTHWQIESFHRVIK